ncbi:rhodanese-like domain-containing protein [Rhodoferax sp.]|uniref:rhodanese-like domain-containing protein n=1 Tax=Rhodoferax sp. TaxID=50421 RepID=UPI002ACE1DAE|nr:rhodanese-like domain-containing protein [Rhodoferax sp.]MDZ7919997.1 rhodanese-like domain-containing protein [Rhodoferax sp.]
MIDQIRPSQLEQWFQSANAPGLPLVLDVREPHELALARVEEDGLEVLAIPMGIIPVRLAELDATRPIACLCHHGARSMQVAMFLQSRGFTQIANIAGGIDAWSVERDPGIARY